MGQVYDIEQVKSLRDSTGVSLGLCTKAITQADGDMSKAIMLLREWGAMGAESRRERKVAEGRIKSYIHGEGRIGVLLQVDCESDFVGKSAEFDEFMHECCLQIAAMRPLYVDHANVPPEIIAQERTMLEAKARSSGKPEAMVSKIVEGQLKKWYSTVCLLDQPWVKDDKLSIRDLLNSLVQKTGENVQVSKFARFEAGAKGD